MTPVSSDRNLLFGVLALQMDFVGRDALIAAMTAWASDKARSLGDILAAQGQLADDERALLEAVVEKHLARHGQDAAQSLQALSPPPPLRHELQAITDADVQASLVHLPTTPSVAPSDAEATTPHVSSAGRPGLRFRILRPHARGGLGQVSVAYDEELRREVALKEMQPRHADDPDSRSRFVLEAEVTGGLEHPGIVPVYGLGTYADGRPFYAMRFVQGDSLKEAITRFHRPGEPGRPPGEQGLELRKLLRRFLDVCNALEYAHSRGVLHRDLKPGNIMVGRYGETLVVDWGLAKVLGATQEGSSERALRTSLSGDPTLTSPGAALGTPAFMSPEQASGRLDRLGPTTDVYGLGATLYCLLTGQAPVTETDAGEALRRVERGDIARPRSIHPATPAALEAICLKAMAHRPEDRYPTPHALAEDLERWLADEPVGAYREPWSRRLTRWTRRHRTGVQASAAALVAVLACGLIGAWVVGREQARTRATGQAEALPDASADAVPALLDELRLHASAVRPSLWQKWRDPALSDAQRLRVGLALADDAEVRTDLVTLALTAATPADVRLVVEALRPHAAEVRDALLTAARDHTRPEARFRALVMLAGLDADALGPELAPRAVEGLLAANPLHVEAWRKALEPVRAVLIPELARAFRNGPTGDRRLAAALLADVAADRPELLIDLVLDADEAQFATLWPRVLAHTARAADLLRDELARPEPPEDQVAARTLLARRQAQAAVALAHLGDPDALWPLLRHTADPGRRTDVIFLLGRLGTPPAPLVRRLEEETDVSVLRALVLSLGEYSEAQLSAEDRGRVTARLLTWYRDHPDPGLHSAIDWLLRYPDQGPTPRKLAWGGANALAAIDRERSGQTAEGRGWIVDGEGHTLAIVRKPEVFRQGSPEYEPFRSKASESPQSAVRIPRAFAIATKELTGTQFRRFMEEHKRSWSFNVRHCPDEAGAAVGITWFDAAEYCNWLSKKAGLPEAEWCYPTDGIKDGMTMPNGYLSRKGYRLPTEAEWEYACRAGATTARFWGSTDRYLSEYAWWYANSEDRTWPVGQLRPNDLGLFDVYGNSLEWCQTRLRAYAQPPGGAAAVDGEDYFSKITDNQLFSRVLRGGSFGSRTQNLRSAARLRDRPGTRFDSVGFRVARTIEVLE